MNVLIRNEEYFQEWKIKSHGRELEAAIKDLENKRGRKTTNQTKNMTSGMYDASRKPKQKVKSLQPDQEIKVGKKSQQTKAAIVAKLPTN